MKQFDVRFVGRGGITASAMAFALVAGNKMALASDGARTGPFVTELAAEKPFLDENAAAMTKMMAGMAATPTGDVDRDFVSAMKAHHQGAIDMALTYLRYGSNEQLRRLAQGIIVEQQQEIAAMTLAVGDPIPSSTAAPTGLARQPTSAPAGVATPGHHHTTNR